MGRGYLRQPRSSQRICKSTSQERDVERGVRGGEVSRKPVNEVGRKGGGGAGADGGAIGVAGG